MIVFRLINAWKTFGGWTIWESLQGCLPSVMYMFMSSVL